MSLYYGEAGAPLPLDGGVADPSVLSYQISSLYIKPFGCR